MSPTYNAETGEMTGGDDLVTEPELSAPLTEQDRQQEEDRARREAIGTMKKPAEPGEPENGPEAYRDRAQFGREEHERIRVAALGDPTHPLNDPRHPDHDATIEKYLRLGEMADGKDYDDPEQNPVVGTLHEGARILAPEEHPPVRIPQLSDEARAAFDLDAGDVEAVVEHQEALVEMADQSGIPRVHIESLVADVAASMESLARDDASDTPEAGRAELARLEGGRAAQIIADAQQLVQLLHDSGQPNLVAAAEDLIATSNAPRVLIGAARLYQELKNLPPQGPWEKLLLSTAERWAARHEVTGPEELPDDYELGRFGRP